VEDSKEKASDQIDNLDNLDPEMLKDQGSNSQNVLYRKLSDYHRARQNLRPEAAQPGLARVNVAAP
jgi:hypothetical protein